LSSRIKTNALRNVVLSSQNVLMSDPQPAVRVCPLSDLAEQPTPWLWPAHLAFGTPALLEGDPGLGKSLITLDLCARLSRGLPWPDGSPGSGQGRAESVMAFSDDESEPLNSMQGYRTRAAQARKKDRIFSDELDRG
jgi:hypothetical protein